MLPSRNCLYRGRPNVKAFKRGCGACTDRVPQIAEVTAALRVKSVTIDDEGAACGADSLSDFDLLRAAVGYNRLPGAKANTLSGGRK